MPHEHISSLPGIVYLVGAGPGDPGLMTVKGLAVLQRADVILYDYLANPALLSEAKEGAQKVCVGKSASAHTISQQEINQLLVKYAREGNIVVRLKGGDPFVFGRGGEEAEALAEHGIRWEIIPGVTSAVAVPAYAGIPVTHRDYSSTFTVVTGNEKVKECDTVDWEALVRLNGTLIFLMGVNKLAFIIQQLMHHGCIASTPVAIIRWGSTPDQQAVTGTLSTIVALAKQAQLKPPAVIVVGKVVHMADQLQWFDPSCLEGTERNERKRLMAEDTTIPIPSSQGEVDELSEEGRARKRQEQAEARTHGSVGRRGLVIVNTGHGKGKTTAALGLLMRSWGQNLRVVMLQFMKATTGNWGEIRAAQRMGVEILPGGKGFTWMSKNIQEDREAALACWQVCREKITSGQYDVIILDELTYTFKYGWIDVEEVLATLRQRDPALHIIITGRNAPQALIDYADLVTEMREIKHPYKLQGVRAQKGIEF